MPGPDRHTARHMPTTAYDAKGAGSRADETAPLPGPEPRATGPTGAGEAPAPARRRARTAAEPHWGGGPA